MYELEQTIITHIHKFEHEKAKELILKHHATLDINHKLKGNPKTKSLLGDTILIAACRRNQNEIVKMILSLKFLYPIDLNLSDDVAGFTPLHIVCARMNKPNPELLKILLNESGIKIHTGGVFGLSSLSSSVLSKDDQILKLILAYSNNDLGYTYTRKAHIKTISSIEHVTRIINQCHTKIRGHFYHDRNLEQRVRLLENFKSNPNKTRRLLKLELGIGQNEAANVFVLTKMIVYGYMEIKNS